MKFFSQIKIFKRLFLHKKKYFMKNQRHLRDLSKEFNRKFYGYYLVYKFFYTEIALLGPKNKTARLRNYYQKTNDDEFGKNFDPRYKFKFMDVFVDNVNTWNFFIEKNNLISNTGKYLEIGCFEGMSSIFILSTLADTECYFVDPFIQYDEIKDAAGIIEFDEIYENFHHNVSHFENRVNIYRETSDNFFVNNKLMFDLIYIDGSHFGEDVYKDSINSFNSLNVNGYIIFDDFFWIHFDNLINNPLGGIFKFLIENKSRLKIIYLSDQLFIQKIS